MIVDKIYGKVVGGSLNVRKEPSTAAAIVKTLKDGAKVQIKEAGDMWHKVTGGYVMAEYVEINQPDQTDMELDEEAADDEELTDEG